MVPLISVLLHFPPWPFESLLNRLQFCGIALLTSQCFFPQRILGGEIIIWQTNGKSVNEIYTKRLNFNLFKRGLYILCCQAHQIIVRLFIVSSRFSLLQLFRLS